MYARPAQVRGKRPWLVVRPSIPRVAPYVGQIFDSRHRQTARQLHCRGDGQDAFHERLGFVVPFVVAGCVCAFAGRGEELELFATVPLGEALRPVDLLHAVVEQNLGSEVGGSVPVGGRVVVARQVAEMPQTLETEDLNDVVDVLLVLKWRCLAALGGRGFVSRQMPQEWMLVHAGGCGAAAPDLQADVVPVLDPVVAFPGSDEAVIHGGPLGVERDPESGHFERLGGIREHVPAEIVQTPEEEKSNVEPGATVKVQQRKAHQVGGMRSDVWTGQFLLVEDFREE